MLEDMLKHYLQEECGIPARFIGFPILSIYADGLEIDYVTDFTKSLNPRDLLEYAIEWGKKNG